MADEPETLEQTQARLAKVGSQATTPYGPESVEPVEAPGDPAFQRPDPYAPGSVQDAAVPTPSTGSRRPMAVVILAVALMLGIGGFVAFFAIGSDSPDEYAPPEEYSEQWQSFPGVSYVDPGDVLNQPSYEQIVVVTEAMASQYRDELTAEFGLVWTQNYESYSGLEDNGYGSDSMLYYYDTGAWQGSVTLDDPDARARILELFTEITASGGEGVLLVNELYSDDDALSQSEFGAAGSEDQALWSFFDSFPALAGMTISSDVYDTNVPVDPSFGGAYHFVIEENGDTLYVSVSGYAGPLLKEADRDAFIAALEPYGGDYTP